MSCPEQVDLVRSSMEHVITEVYNQKPYDPYIQIFGIQVNQAEIIVDKEV